MAGSTSHLDLISSGQAQKEITANSLFDAGSPAYLYGRRGSTTAGLTWGFYGGFLNGVASEILNGTVLLTANTTNYIEAEKSTGVVSVKTGSFSSLDTHISLYIVKTNPTGVHPATYPTGGYQDVRPNPMIGGTYVLPTASTTVKGGVKVDGTTITIAGDVISAVGGGGGLVNFEEEINTAYHSTSNNTASLKTVGTAATINLALVTKNGFLSLSIPNNLTSGGNIRGQSAIDLQQARTAANQVAKGNNSFQLGSNNKTEGLYSGSIGRDNDIGLYSDMSFLFGESNIVTSSRCFGIGRYNSITSASNNSYALGTSNNITNSENAFITGFSNICSYAKYGMSLSMFSNINAYYATTFGFKASTKGVNNSWVYGIKTISNVADGSSQAGKYVLAMTSNTAVQKALTTENNATVSIANQITLQNYECKTFHGTITLKDTANTGKTASFEIKGHIERMANAASTVLRASSITEIWRSPTAITDDYSVTLSANTTLGCLTITAGYASGTSTLKATANIECSEVI